MDRSHLHPLAAVDRRHASPAVENFLGGGNNGFVVVQTIDSLVRLHVVEREEVANGTCDDSPFVCVRTSPTYD